MKNRQVRPAIAGGFTAVALLLVTASAVWACTAQPRIFSLGPQVGPVGLEITLEGEALGGSPSTGSAIPVEVRWNSLDGPKIGEGAAAFNGTFAVKARIPQAEPGVYFLVVKAGDAGVVRSAFEVTGEKALASSDAAGATRPAASSADLWQGFSTRAQADQAASLAAESRGSGPQAAIGGALLVAGLAILSSGLVLARRRQGALVDRRRNAQS